MFSSGTTYYQRLQHKLSKEAGAREMSLDAQLALLLNVLSYIQSPDSYRISEDQYQNLMDKIDRSMRLSADFNAQLHDGVKLILADAIELVSVSDKSIKIGSKIESAIKKILDDDNLTPDLIDACAGEFVNKLTQGEFLQHRIRSEPGSSISPPRKS